jgi:hypothetical protein
MLLRIRKSSDTESELFDSSQSSPERLSKVNNYVLMIKKLKCKKQTMNWLDVNWGWSWDRFADKIGLKKGTNAQLWYKNIIVVNENTYRKFVITHKGQNTITVEYEQER